MFCTFLRVWTDTREENFLFVFSCYFPDQVEVNANNRTLCLHWKWRSIFRLVQSDTLGLYSSFTTTGHQRKYRQIPSWSKFDCTVQSVLKAIKAVNVVLDQDWKKTFHVERHIRQSKDLLINSLIFIMSYYLGLNFLITIVCVQIKPGMRRLKVFLMLL